MNEKKLNHGFKIPDGYFEDFENNLQISLELENAKKNLGFKVPERYFDTIELEILDSMKISELNSKVNNPEPKVINLFQKRWVYFAAAIAACVALIFTLFPQKDRDTLNLADISAETIESYFIQENTDFSAFDLVTLSPNEDFENLKNEVDFLNIENIEDYLLEK